MRLLRAPDSRPSPVEALSGGVSSEIWKVGDVCVKRALPRLRVAQRWEAPVERNRYERLWLEPPAQRRRAPRRACSPATIAPACSPWSTSTLPVWKERLRQGDADPAFAAQVGATLAAIHAATAGRASRRALRDRRDLPRHPPRALPRRHRDGASRPADRRFSPWLSEPRKPRSAWCTATSARRTSSSAPWTGISRCGMRLVRRSGVRPRLLPEPSAAEVPVGARQRAGIPRLLRRAARRPTWQGVSFEDVENAHRHPAPGAAARARRRQVACRIPDGAAEASSSAGSRAS